MNGEIIMYYYITCTVCKMIFQEGDEEGGTLIPRLLLFGEDGEHIDGIADLRSAFPPIRDINQMQSQLWKDPKKPITENKILGFLQHEWDLVLKKMEKKGKGTIDQSWRPPKYHKNKKSGNECETDAIGRSCLQVEALGSRKIMGEMYLILMEQTFDIRNALEGGRLRKECCKRPPDLAAEFGLPEKKTSCCVIS